MSPWDLPRFSTLTTLIREGHLDCCRRMESNWAAQIGHWLDQWAFSCITLLLAQCLIFQANIAFTFGLKTKQHNLCIQYEKIDLRSVFLCVFVYNLQACGGRERQRSELVLVWQSPGGAGWRHTAFVRTRSPGGPGEGLGRSDCRCCHRNNLPLHQFRRHRTNTATNKSQVPKSVGEATLCNELLSSADVNETWMNKLITFFIYITHQSATTGHNLTRSLWCYTVTVKSVALNGQYSV